MLFIEDAIKISDGRVPFCVMNGFLSECVAPLYRTLTSYLKEIFDINTVIYILSILLKNASEPLLTDSLTLMLFGRYQLKQVTQRLTASY
jgi:hypothetical protein